MFLNNMQPMGNSISDIIFPSDLITSTTSASTLFKFVGSQLLSCKKKKNYSINLWLIKYPQFIYCGHNVFVTTFIASSHPFMCDSRKEVNRPLVQQLKSPFPDIMSLYKGTHTYVNTLIKMVKLKELETERIKITLINFAKRSKKAP